MLILGRFVRSLKNKASKIILFFQNDRFNLRPHSSTCLYECNCKLRKTTVSRRQKSTSDSSQEIRDRENIRSTACRFNEREITDGTIVYAQAASFLAREYHHEQ